jgi:hypothetical protein
MTHTIRNCLALTIVSCLAVGCDATSGPQGVRRFHSVMTPVVEVNADMSVYLNQQKPQAGGGTYSIGDPLPEFERVIPDDAIGQVTVEIEGDEFTLDARFTGLPMASEVTDPRASSQRGTRVVGDYWDIWLLSAVPNVVTIQMGLLVADPSSPGVYTLHFDSRTDVDHAGRKITVNNMNSILTTWPDEPLSLYDVSLIGMDIESSSGPEEPSGQHRLNDVAPFSRSIDWAKPDP